MTGLLKINNNFIQKSTNLFGNRFEYLSDYKSCHDLIELKCIEHNKIFKVSARNHLRSVTGSCHKCKTNHIKNIKNVEQEYFINKSKSIFNDKFNYSKTIYKNKKDKITLICNSHNYEFEIEPKSHYYSNSGGCIECNNEIKNRVLLNEIINKYNNKFNFSTIQLKLTKNKVQIIKCNVCNNNVKMCLTKFDGVCSNCIINENKNNQIIKEELLKIGEKIKNTIEMRLNFKPDEYIRKINIDGLDEYYVSNYGNIFNKNKSKLEGHKNLQGYIFVRLKYNEKNQLFRVHRLVCEVFNGKASENKNIVDHINRIRDDNKVENLKWVTHEENMNNKTEPNLNKNKVIINKYLSLDKKDEIFKIIINSNYGNFENYSVSNYGRIKNNKTNKILKPNITDEGYMNISLINKENRQNIPIHRLVCEYFNKKMNDNDNVVNHINEKKYDNYYKNLEWTSIKKNNQHSKNISINMLDDDKNIIKSFSSYTEAFKYLKLKHSGCIKTQMDKGRKAYGYFWSINRF
jgi:hypothetical protein